MTDGADPIPEPKAQRLIPDEEIWVMTEEEKVADNALTSAQATEATIDSHIREELNLFSMPPVDQPAYQKSDPADFVLVTPRPKTTDIYSNKPKADGVFID